MKPSHVRTSNSVACLILSFNKPEITRRCVTSCLNFFNETDIFLIHNGSLPIHQNQLRADFPQINHLIIPQNKGYSGGTQFGLDSVFLEQLYPWVFFITNDCELLSFPSDDHAIFSGSPSVFAGGRLLRRDGLLECTYGAVNLKKGQLRHLKTSNTLVPHEELYLPGHFFLMSMPTWKTLQTYDTHLHTYWEDVDLSLRATRSGIKLAIVHELTARHAGGKTTRGDSYYSLYLYQRNRLRVTMRYTSSKTWFRIRFFMDLTKLFWRHLKNRKWEHVRYVLDILRDRP